MSEKEEIEVLLNLEAARGKALVAKTFDVLRTFVPKDVVHVHTNGKIDNYESYFHVIQHDYEFKRVERGELNVRLNGDSAVMTGLQTIEIRIIASEETRVVTAHVIQVWFKRQGKWYQVAFQATNAA